MWPLYFRCSPSHLAHQLPLLMPGLPRLVLPLSPGSQAGRDEPWQEGGLPGAVSAACLGWASTGDCSPVLKRHMAHN